MWPFKKKPRRRVEVRKQAASVRGSRWKRFHDAGGVGSVLLAAMFFFALVLLDSAPSDPLPYRTGQYVPQDVYARVPFRVPSAQLQEDLKREAEIRTPPAFELNQGLLDEISAALGNLPDQLKATTQPADLDADFATRFNISAEQLDELTAAVSGEEKRQRFEQNAREMIQRLARLPIVQPQAVRREIRGASEAVLYRGEEPWRTGIRDLITVSEDRRLAAAVATVLEPFRPVTRPHVRALLLEELQSRPIYTFDAARTRSAIEEAQREIERNPPPEAYIEYVPGQAPLARRTRQLDDDADMEGLTQAELELLEREHEAYLQELRIEHPWRALAVLGGRAVIWLLITVVLAAYVANYQPRIVRNHLRGVALSLVLLAMIAIGKIPLLVPSIHPGAAVFPALLGAIILTIVYDQRFALATGALLSLAIVMQVHAGLSLLVTLVVAQAVAVFLLREVRNRSKLIEVAAAAALAGFILSCSLGLALGKPWRFFLVDGAWAAGTALLAGLVIQALLPLIERAFNVVTSMTLLEWCDASKPLLKRLAMEAPGTYNHSLQLGAMCEAAAEAIGARGLLARVGAYYHDIGKINKPAYFIENQSGPSKHERLSPAMSLLVIIGHVKDGLQMAREYGLPPVLREFIATHHGTTLVQYFYHAAVKKRQAESEKAPEESEFRYPGPKPRSKEAAILMLADAAESSVRAMTEPTPGRIENQVHTMISRRLMDGQLDMCEMTLAEVHLAEQSLVKSLCGMYHARISYPTPAGKKASAGEVQAQKKAKAAKTQQGDEEASNERKAAQADPEQPQTASGAAGGNPAPEHESLEPAKASGANDTQKEAGSQRSQSQPEE